MSPRSQTQVEQASNEIKELFWRRGYDDTSIEDVVQATGLNRYSLYNEFGGKRELFLTALDVYCHERKSVFLSSLNDSDKPPMEAIRNMFEFSISEIAERGNGCLMCNVARERGGQDPVISERLQSYLEQIKYTHIDALERARDRGELNPVVTPEQGAALLLAVKFGLGVHAKNGASREAMLDVFDTAMALLTNVRAQ